MSSFDGWHNRDDAKARRREGRRFGTALALAALVASLAAATAPRPAQGAEGSSDPRLGPLRDLDGHFPFAPSASRESWEARAQALRRQVRVALGLWPWPTRTPLNAVVHGAVAREGYTVERVFFESVPGHFVTGSLYRPSSARGATEGKPETATKRRPGVLSPHGHWPGGRFQDVDEKPRRLQLASGAERFDHGARHVLQARAVQLARMGTVVLLYDMVGYADSVQIPQAVAHSARGRQREESGRVFFSMDAERQLSSILGLQMWNAVRALDFLAGLPDVDPARLAVTGASGGGTQTFLLGAIDDRVAVAFPAVMVSARMQGGCTCENADYLRIGTGNVELAALFAPKPLGMTAADDWTKTMPSDGFPELQAHYALFDAKANVQLFPFLQHGHNYNHVSRTAMYGWLNRHLGLGHEEPVLERDFVPLSKAEATVWDAAHPAPAGGEAHETTILDWWREDTDRQLAAARPRDAASLEAWRTLMGGAVGGMLARPAPAESEVEVASGASAPQGQSAGILRTLRVRPHGEYVSAMEWAPTGQVGEVTVVTSSRGLAGMSGADGALSPVLQPLLAGGQRVVAIDVLWQRGAAVAANRLVENRASAAYTFGYNPPLVVRRAHDTLAALRHARTLAGPDGRVTLVALDGAATAWAALARAQAGPLVDAAAFVTEGFRFVSAGTLEDASFLPGGAKYGDLPALLTLAAPAPLWVAGEAAPSLALARDAYRAAGAPKALVVSRASGERAVNDAVRWITNR
jgi:dienelactone hydrolase